MAGRRLTGLRGPLPPLLFLALLVLLASGAASAGTAPVAIIDTPDPDTSWEACLPIPLSALGSFDPDGGPLYYIWALPNETLEGLTAQQVNYTNLTAVGDYSITLTVRDNETFEDNQTVPIHVTPCNLRPVAVIAAPLNGTRFFTDEFVNLSAAGSYDPDGSILSYDWAVNGGAVGSGANRSIRFSRGVQNITLTVHDDRGGAASATVSITIEVNQPPQAEGPSVAPPVGFDGDVFAFAFTYFDANGEPPAEALLLLDGSPHAMAALNQTDPRQGRGFGLSLALAAGRHSFYFLVQDGNLTNLSATVVSPDVYLNLSRLSSDGLVSVETSAVAPANLSVSKATGALPDDPPSLAPVSDAYFVNASGVVGRNFTLLLSFTSGANLDASTALIMRLTNGSWQTLVTAVDSRAHTAAISGEFGDLPAVFRAFAGPVLPPVNQPPDLQIAHRAAAGEYFPNSTVTFDAAASRDPENATLLFLWRFTGPGVATGWLAGPSVTLSFPRAGIYSVELQGDDGSGAVAFKNTTLEIRDRPAPVVNTLEEPVTLAGLAAAVAVSAGLAFWWRSRRPRPKKQYEDQYGGLYKQKSMEEKEYAELFEKFAIHPGTAEPPPAPAPEPDPPSER